MNVDIEVEVTLTYTVSERIIKGLLSSAFEGGSNYWYAIEKIEGLELADSIVGVPLNGGKLFIRDTLDDSRENLYILDKEAISKGLKRLLNLKNKDGRMHKQAKNVINDNFDAETGDCFLQIALFDEIIYG